MQKPLQIFNASAGSGKTFSLVQTYLKLTLTDEMSLKSFSKILAMTFTNKAAWEMKERIIQALDELAYPNRKTEKETKKAKNLLEATQKNTKLSAEQIQKRAAQILTEILHTYEEFNILTIDKFNLRLVRTFSRDLDLKEDFEVTLDLDQMLEQVIDELMSKIGKEGEEELTEMMLEYAKRNADDGTKWNFREDVLKFSRILVKEGDQPYIEKLLKGKYDENHRVALFEELERIQLNHRKKCIQLHTYFKGLNSAPDDYPRPTQGLYKFLDELPIRDIRSMKSPNSYVLNTINGSIVKEGKHNVDTVLIQQTVDLLYYEEEISDKVFTLLKLRSNFYNLALLQHISNEFETFKERNNIIGIFELSPKIAELLKKENAPYIYERLGNRFNHYLLDEFQDTSRLQWVNLIPLVHDSLGENHENLIVGDPKQAIYRFRNGLVEQFVALPSIYNPENDFHFAEISRFFEKMGIKTVLEDNYRSKRNIVEFNNLFFRKLISKLPERFEEYYKDVEQNVKGGEGGLSEITLFSSKKKKRDYIEAQEAAFLLKKVKESLDNEFLPGDICILTRSNKEGRRFAKTLTQNEYTVVSADSLFVSSDATVRFVIDYLNLRRNSGNPTLQMKFATNYFKYCNIDPIKGMEEFWKKGERTYFDFNAFIVSFFEEEKKLFFPYENLYDLGEQFINLIGIDPFKNPYIHHLLEVFHNFDLKFGPDIRGFIEEWNNKLQDSPVQLPKNDKAIQLSTIHKAKGLEFPVVILPNLSWKIRMSNSRFIETPEGDLLYTNLSGNDAPEFIEKAFDEEYAQTLLDELNILYVAFTRPVNRLYALLDTALPNDMKGKFSQLNYIISLMIEELKPSEKLEKTGVFIRYGSPNKNESTGKQKSLLFSPASLKEYIWFPELAFRDSKAIEQEELNEEQQFGTQLHQLLSMIEEAKNIDNLAEKLTVQGKIDEKWKEKLIKEASEITELLSEQSFFKDAEQTLNETDIIIGENELKRPDRIYLSATNEATVVDFKTGERHHKYHQQVREYCKYLSEMGFSKVKGYLLYTKENELVLVV